VLTAGSIMTPASPAADMSALGRVARTETVETIASRVLETREPVAVTDESGAVIGEVGAPAVLDVLARRWMAA
jgi:hypothetical protein